MVLKATDIRIGNWYKGDCTNQENHQITEKDITDLFYDPLDDYFCAIPLTEEILLKCGYELMIETEYTVNTYAINDSVRLWNINGNFTELIYEINGRKSIQIKHLHQLQNLYFALTGEELNVEL